MEDPAACDLLLLSDKYPPVGWRNDLYPVGVAVRPGQLNRIAVLFRLILVIPALLTEVGWHAACWRL